MSADESRARTSDALFMPFASVAEALADVVALHGTRTALTALASADDAAPRQWSHAAFHAEVLRSAGLFASLAGTEEARVALLMPPLPQAWFALWGAETAGVACPINHALDEAHLSALLDAAGVNIVVTLAPGHPASDIGDRIARLTGRAGRRVLSVGGPPAPGWLDFDAARAEMPATFAAPADADRIAALFHTGGTTGLPKLARHTHANQLHVAFSAAQRYGATEHDVVLNGFPLFHVAGAFVYGLSLLLAGAEIVLPPPLGWRDPAFAARVWTVVRERRVTLLAAVPTLMTLLLAAPRAAGDAAGVRLLLTGGSPLPTELANRFEREIGVPVRNILGMTECAGVISIEAADAPRVPGSCGRPLPFGEVQAIDADGRPVGAGQTGVLRLCGPNVGPGYTDAARDAGTFEDGWLITGDIGHLDDDGRIFVTGRAKDVIIRGAHNIDPSAIEEALLAHPDVQMAAAVGEPDEYAGELPVAFVVLRAGCQLEPQALLAFAAAHVAEAAACPKRIGVLPALPLTAIGKVYKPALRRLATQRVIDDRLARAGLATTWRADSEDRAGRVVLRFAPVGDALASAGPSRTASIAALRGLMAGFAIDYEIERRDGVDGIDGDGDRDGGGARGRPGATSP